MAVLGLGTDIVEISRIEKMLTRTGNAFAKRVLTLREFEQYQSKKNPAPFLAKRFAAKEAAAKALGTGIAAGITFHDFVITNDNSGQPILSLFGKAAEIAKVRGINNILLTISDEKRYAVATVLLQKVELLF